MHTQSNKRQVGTPRPPRSRSHFRGIIENIRVLSVPCALIGPAHRFWPIGIDTIRLMMFGGGRAETIKPEVCRQQQTSAPAQTRIANTFHPRASRDRTAVAFLGTKDFLGGGFSCTRVACSSLLMLYLSNVTVDAGVFASLFGTLLGKVIFFSVFPWALLGAHRSSFTLENMF